MQGRKHWKRRGRGTIRDVSVQDTVVVCDVLYARSLFDCKLVRKPSVRVDEIGVVFLMSIQGDKLVVARRGLVNVLHAHPFCPIVHLRKHHYWRLAELAN